MWRGVEGWNEGEEKGLRDLNHLLQLESEYSRYLQIFT